MVGNPFLYYAGIQSTQHPQSSRVSLPVDDIFHLLVPVRTTFWPSSRQVGVENPDVTPPFFLLQIGWWFGFRGLPKTFATIWDFSCRFQVGDPEDTCRIQPNLLPRQIITRKVHANNCNQLPIAEPIPI
jgi:hypothetical protein